MTSVNLKIAICVLIVVLNVRYPTMKISFSEKLENAATQTKYASLVTVFRALAILIVLLI